MNMRNHSHTDLPYAANLIPTTQQLLSGELEPTSKTFKAAVGAYNTAIWQGTFIALWFQWLKMLGFNVSAPDTFIGMAAHATFFAFFQAGWANWYIRRHRKPSIAQLDHLAGLVRDDPALARQVALFGVRDFTFHRIQQFILKNSDRANGKRMDAALDRLDAAVEGRG